MEGPETKSQDIESSSKAKVTLRHPAWQICVLVLSIFALISISIETLFVKDPEIKQILVSIDLIVCAVFFMDFLVLFFTAPSKKKYMMRWGWVDLISSMPLVDPLRWGRLARVVRIVTIFRAVKSVSVLGRSVTTSPFETLSVMVFLVVFLSFSISAGLILGFERGYNSTLGSSSDALWWSFLSIMNAKAGFQYPVSPEGILNTVYLNKIGLLLFAYINGSIVAWLLNNRSTNLDENGTDS